MKRELRLIPSEEKLKQLHKDYSEMVSAQMFYETPVSFENILDRLGSLESQINKLQ